MRRLLRSVTRLPVAGWVLLLLGSLAASCGKPGASRRGAEAGPAPVSPPPAAAPPAAVWSEPPPPLALPLKLTRCRGRVETSSRVVTRQQKGVAVQVAGPLQVMFTLELCWRVSDAAAVPADWPVKGTLFRGTDPNGPFTAVWSRGLHVTAAAVGQGTPVPTFLRDDDAAAAGRNALWYRIRFETEAGQHIQDLPLLEYPVVLRPVVQGDSLLWPAPEPEAPCPEASLEFSVPPLQLDLPFQAVYGRREATPLPPGMASLPLSITLVAPGLEPFEFAFGDGAEPRWQPATARTTLNVVGLPSVHKARNQMTAVLPAAQVSGYAPGCFTFLPRPEAYTGCRFYWADDPVRAPVTEFELGAQPRELVAEFTAPGEPEPQTAAIVLPPAPPPVSIRDGAGQVVIAWDASGFARTSALAGATAQIERADRSAVVTVPAAQGEWNDTEVGNGASYAYAVRFDLPASGTGWVQGYGRVAVPVALGRRLASARQAALLRGQPGVGAAPPRPASLRSSVEYLHGRPAAVGGPLNVALGRAELAYEGTDQPHRDASLALIRALAAEPAVRLLDRFNTPAILQESGLAATALQTDHGILFLDAPLLLRLVDYSRCQGNGIELWLTEGGGTGRSVQIGGLTCAEASPAAIQQRLLEPLLAALREPLRGHQPAALRTRPVQRLVMGHLYPLDQPRVVADAEALALEWAILLAGQMPGCEVVTREQLGAVLEESRRVWQDTGADGQIRPGEVLLSGRVWRCDDGGLGLFFQATYLGTGEILGVWECAREDESSVAGLAAWCRTLRIATELPAAAENPKPYLWDVQQRPIYRDYLPAPSVGNRGLGKWRAEQLGKVDQLADSANRLWAEGQRTAAIELLEGLWLRRSVMPEESRRRLPEVALQLAAYYGDTGESRGQETVLAWLLEGERWRAVRGLTASDVKERLDKAQGLHTGRTRALEIAAREHPTAEGRPEAAPNAAGVAAAPRPLPSSPHRVVSVEVNLAVPSQTTPLPPMSWVAPVPRLLDHAKRRQPMERRSQDDPLVAVRPSVGTEFGYLFEPYAAAYAAYLVADYRAYHEGCATLAKLRQALATEHPEVDLWKTPIAIRVHDGYPRPYWVAPPGSAMPTEDEVFVVFHLDRLRKTPYLMSKAYRLAPPEVVRPILRAAKAEVLDRHGALRRGDTPAPPHLAMPMWYQIVALDLLAEAGDAEAQRLCGEAQTLALQLLPELQALTDAQAAALAEARHERNGPSFGRVDAYSSALRLLATHGNAAAHALCCEERILRHIVGWQTGCEAEDTLRLLIDLGCRRAFALSMAHPAMPSSVSNPDESAFLWRSAEEIAAFVDEFGAILHPRYADRLRHALGRPLTE